MDLVSRFERRLSDETGKLRVELATAKFDILLWSFAFWVSSVGANAALFHYFLAR